MECAFVVEKKEMESWKIKDNSESVSEKLEWGFRKYHLEGN